MSVLTTIFGTKYQRDIKKIKPIINKVNALEDEMASLSDKDLRSKTDLFRERLTRKEKPESLIDLLAEAFAVVREASKRTLEMRHFDVQLIGGLVLFEGKIAEMKTGEGKTLAATLTAYLRALGGKGVHVVTVNSHLAKRDANWMRPIYEFLGLTVGYIVEDMHSEERRGMYSCDITYGTNNEFGFDYLRDSMVDSLEQKVQRGHYFCIIDEVDSILIDEARTPLIISGPSESDVEKYYDINKIVPRLKEGQKDEKQKEVAGTGDFIVDLKDNNVVITEEGTETIEKLLNVDNLFAPNNMEILHHVNQGLKAHHLFTRDVDYMVENGKIIIIDEFTGRKMSGRRFSDGLHQAIEAKENVQILSENQTLASITFQNYFRMYNVVSGMTGTADTEAEEFKKIYKLEVVCIPPNVPVKRKDRSDKIYRTENEKFEAIKELVIERHKQGVPILLGTSSVEKSELLSHVFKKAGLPHEVLNAKNHEREANIIIKAGEAGAITIATNMAGRGTDIKLDDTIKERGGLLVIGSERHESRRIDNQLRGRSGRQGDPGESIFYLSLEDDLMRRFGSERLSSIMLKLGMTEGQEIEHPIISNSIKNAQKRVEGRNFDIRKYLLEYDDVMNVQRTYIYRERNFLLSQEDLIEKIKDYFDETLTKQFEIFAGDNKNVSQALYERVKLWLESVLIISFPAKQEVFLKQSYDKNEDMLYNHLVATYEKKRIEHPQEVVGALEKYLLLQIIDTKWKEHLLHMDHLREGINLRAYGEKKPLTEFKKEGFHSFKEMLSMSKQESMERLLQVKIAYEDRPPLPESNIYRVNKMQQESLFQDEASYESPSPKRGSRSTSDAQSIQEKKATAIRNPQKIGRNQSCYCGSGKKFKHCHGKI